MTRCASRNSGEKRTDRHNRRRQGHAAGGSRTRQGGAMNYYDVTQKVQEQRDADFLKAMKKNKHFWADPMSYPVRIEK